jgi:hypothetical protein
LDFDDGFITKIAKLLPTCGAARPTPIGSVAASKASSISLIKFKIAVLTLATGLALEDRIGLGALTIISML